MVASVPSSFLSVPSSSNIETFILELYYWLECQLSRVVLFYYFDREGYLMMMMMSIVEVHLSHPFMNLDVSMWLPGHVLCEDCSVCPLVMEIYMLFCF